MGVESAALSYPYRSASAAACLLPFALKASGLPRTAMRSSAVREKSPLQLSAVRGGMGFAYSLAGMTLPKGGLVSEESAA